MKKSANHNLLVINTACILALIAILMPLLVVAQYNYPSADDWSFSVYSYNAVQHGEGIIGALKGAIEAVKYYFVHWDGRFSISFLGALQPGIWGEKCYSVVAWIMIGTVIFSEVFLFKEFICTKGAGANSLLIIPIVAPALILQIMYTPSPEESFYWYNGSVNYTFIYGLSLILIVLFVRLGVNRYSKRKYALMAMISCLLAILIGGDNFATSLSCFLALIVITVLFCFFDRKALYRTWYITLLLGICLMVCILAPGNEVRVSNNFGGETGSAVEAIVMSLVRSFLNIYSWTNYKVMLMLLFILPFVWKCVNNMQCRFRFPVIFTIITFGLYASQVAPTMYVDGTTGGGRMAAILFYSYFVWLLGNIIYWIGWLSKNGNKLTSIINCIQKKCGKLLLLYCVLVGIGLVSTIYFTDLKDVSSYRAYRSLRQGWAQQYAAEWDARLEILHDESVKEVVFAPLTVYPEVIQYTDLQEENGYVWVNHACAKYYEKDSITVIPPQN